MIRKILHTKFIIVSLLVQLCLNSYGQAPQIKRLKIGDQIPDITMAPILQFNRTSAKLSDFRGQLLILDFWSIWCGGCIKGMPELEKLQKEFKGQVTILPVSFTKSEKEVSAFLDKMQKHNQAINLPSVVYTSMKNDLMTMFPCYGFPMDVWIDGKGKLIAITDAYYVTAENIRKALNHEPMNLPVAGAYIKFPGDSGQTRLTVDDRKEKGSFYSRITPYSDTVSSLNAYRFVIRKREHATRLSYYNTSVVDLFKASVTGKLFEHSPNNWVSVEIPDSAALFFPKNDTNFYQNLKKNSYCYESQMPESVTFKDALAIMNKNLSVYFGIESSLEKRPVSCYFLRRISDSFPLNTKTEKEKVVIDLTIGFYHFENIPIKQFVSSLTSRKMPLIVDKTGYSGNIDIEIVVHKEQNIESINQILKKDDLILVAGTEVIDVLVLKKKKLPL